MKFFFSNSSTNWNVQIGVIERNKLETRFGTVIYFQGEIPEQPSAETCRMITEKCVKMHNEKCLTDYVPFDVTIRVKKERLFSIIGSEEYDLVFYSFVDDIYTVNETMRRRSCGFAEISFMVPEIQKSAIQAAADAAGESINEYANKALRARMGLQEWPVMHDN